MHFAFVACNRNASRFREDPSYVYRCENLAAGLEAAGHQVSLLHLSALPIRRCFDVVVFHRPSHSLRLAMALRLLRAFGVLTVADLDDLIFDEALVEFSPAIRNDLLSPHAVRKQFARNLRALRAFDRISVSTAPLAEHVKRLIREAKVEVIANSVHHAWHRFDEVKGRDMKNPVITYLPGTRSHDRDFAQLAEPLALFLRMHRHVRLHVTGPLNFELPARTGQIRHYEKLPFERYYTRVREGWVNLAPLEPTPFNSAKSALKVMEAGYWQVPTICSPNSDNWRFEGAGALVASTGEEWFSHLENLMSSDRYNEVTENLRSRVLKRASLQASTELFLRFVQEKQ